MKSSAKIIGLPNYEAPLVNSCLVAVERGYSSTSERVELEDLGETKSEGEW
ncbi:MAG: hypothetical protein IKY24_06945 [Alistipes sp.]|nr:hypothetical protein [Alistipes sp.]